LVKAFRLQKAVDAIRKEEHLKELYSKVSGTGFSFYDESKVRNYQENSNAIRIAANAHIRGELLVFPYGGSISIGEYTFIGEGSRIWSGENIKIGSNVLISHNVNIIDTNTHETDSEERKNGFISIVRNGQPKEKGSIKSAPIVIHDKAWINFNAIILKGVTIGEGAIIAAGTIVAEDVPPYCLYSGNPGRVIKQLK
jgi:acetyltransferase-like isoleucine patch superfamily enzyme